MAKPKYLTGGTIALVGLAGSWAVLNQHVAYVAVAAYLGVTGAAVWIALQNPEAFRDMLREKAPEMTGSTFEPPASFSRLVGIVGAAMLLAFLWCYGLVILLGVVDPDAETYAKRLGPLEASIKDFIYIGACLFAPYAANQLSKILGPRVLSVVDQNGLGGALDDATAQGLERSRVMAVLQAVPDPT